MSDIPALYCPVPLTVGNSIIIEDEQFRHIRALRLRDGQPVLLLDGNGTRAEAEIAELGRSTAILTIRHVSVESGPEGPKISLAIGILDDRARMEWIVEKAVELGAAELIPLRSERAEGHLHRNRLERVAVAALKQSQRSYLTTITEPMTLPELLSDTHRFDLICICHERAEPHRGLPQALATNPDATHILALIGPEGGFTDEEVSTAESSGAHIVSLGNTRLRAETAALAALVLIRLNQ